MSYYDVWVSLNISAYVYGLGFVYWKGILKFSANGSTLGTTVNHLFFAYTVFCVVVLLGCI